MAVKEPYLEAELVFVRARERIYIWIYLNYLVRK